MTWINPKFVLQAPLSNTSIARPIEVAIGSRSAGVVIEPNDWPSNNSEKKVFKRHSGDVTITCFHDYNARIVIWESTRLGGMYLLPPEHDKLTAFGQIGVGFMDGYLIKLEVDPYDFGDKIIVKWDAALGDFSESGGIWSIKLNDKPLPPPKI